MVTRTPPRFVPTLTEVVREGAAAMPAVAFSEEQLVHRIMQRIDLALDRRLREAIATVVLEQTRSLGPTLREEIETVVRQTVSQALAEELTASTKPGQRTS
jgi:FixJ family two-component response regulator